MLGIGKEASIFLYAVLTGVVTFSAYQIPCPFRNLIPHHIAAVNAEDFCIGSESAPTYFGKCIETTYGSIRWFRAWCRSWKYPGIFYQNFLEKNNVKMEESP